MQILDCRCTPVKPLSFFLEEICSQKKTASTNGLKGLLKTIDSLQKTSPTDHWNLYKTHESFYIIVVLLLTFLNGF